MVCVNPVASRPAIYVFGVTLEVWAVDAGTRSGFWECEADGPACNKDLMRIAGVGSAFNGLACARLGS